MKALLHFDTGRTLTASNTSNGAPELATLSETGHDPNPNWLAILLNVTAASGTTPSLAVEVQWSHDGTVWSSASPQDTFTAITATGSVVKNFQVKGRFARLSYTITGTTPSFTFTATGYSA